MSTASAELAWSSEVATDDPNCLQLMLLRGQHATLSGQSCSPFSLKSLYHMVLLKRSSLAGGKSGGQVSCGRLASSSHWKTNVVLGYAGSCESVSPEVAGGSKQKRFRNLRIGIKDVRRKA